MTEHVDSSLALLKDDVTNQRFVPTIGGLHFDKGHFVEDRAKAVYLNAHRPADFIILVGSKSPNLSFHAAGKTINDAFVSTSPSQVRLFEVSRTFSIFTETIIRFKYGFCAAFEKSWLLFITHPSSAASLSAEGAQFNSLGQRPRSRAPINFFPALKARNNTVHQNPSAISFRPYRANES